MRGKLMTDGYYVTLGSSADYYEVGARAAENIYLDSVIIFLYVILSSPDAIADPQLMFDRIPKHCPYFAIHYYRSGQDCESKLGGQADDRYKHSSFSRIEKCTMPNVSHYPSSKGYADDRQHAMCTQDVEYLG